MNRIKFLICLLFIFCITLGSLSSVFAETVEFDSSYRNDEYLDSEFDVYNSNDLTWYFLFSGSIEPHSSVNHGYQDLLGWGDRKYAFLINNSDYDLYYSVYSAPTPGGWYATYALLYSPDLTDYNGYLDVDLVCYDSAHGSPYTHFNDIYNSFYFTQPGYPFFYGNSGYRCTPQVGESAYNILVQDYMFPAVDIEDADLDIKGLVGSVSGSQYVDDPSQKNIGWKDFFQGLIGLLPNNVDHFVGVDNTFLTQDLGYVSTTVPGVQLIWDSPDISTIANYSDPSQVQYTIWADGSSYAEITLDGSIFNDTVRFDHLQLRDGSIVFNPAVSAYYNTNSDSDVLLNYFRSNADFIDTSNHGLNDKLIFNTTFTRIYIQAHQLDENGDNHMGAVSYVDFSTGSPVVHEGVTANIEDIPPSDSDTGTDQTITQDYTVSGDTIIYGDTITENNTTNYITGGLIVPDGTSFLTAGLQLINAILELIKLLFASLLVPFITLGWTGHF